MNETSAEVTEAEISSSKTAVIHMDDLGTQATATKGWRYVGFFLFFFLFVAEEPEYKPNVTLRLWLTLRDGAYNNKKNEPAK